MASFTDIVPQFTPYIQQLPVDAMVKVGQQKQDQYDQGIQKIQSNIDAIGGLDIYRDVDKAYFQSKINELGNGLKIFMASDFSDSQLVNSTNGMTSRLVKDENIQNAVASTSKIRKGFTAMDEAIKSGKSSPSNEWEFKSSVNNYANKEGVGASYSGEYKPYTNYSKNALEVIKSLVKNENIKDISLEYDPKGNITGILDATTRTKISGITPERIQQALMVGLTPEDFSQMQTDGRYNYSNVSPDKFNSDITKSYQTTSAKYIKQKEFLINSLTTTNSVVEKQKLQEQIDSIDKTVNSLANEYTNMTSSISNGNIEGVKAKLFTTNWINNFAQTFSNQDVSQTDETNPYQQVKQYRETQALEWKKFSMTHEQKERFEQNSNYYKDENLKIDKAKLKADAGGQFGAVPFSVDRSTLPSVTLDKLKTDIDNDIISLQKSDDKIMKTFDQEGNQGWLDQQRLAWQKSPSSVDALLSAHFTDTENRKREVYNNAQMITDLNKKGEDFIKGKVPIPKGSQTLRVNFPSGSYEYTPQEMIAFNNKFKGYVNISSSGGTGGGSGSVSYNDVKAKQELSPKEYFLYEAQKNQKTDTQKTLVKNLQFYNTNVNIPYAKVLKEKDEFVAKEIKSRVMAMQGVSYEIPTGDEKSKSSFGTTLQQFADLADKQNGGMANSPTLDTGELRAIAGDLQNANIRIVEGTRYAPAMYEVTASDKKGNTQTFRVPPEAYASVFGNRYEADPAILAARPYINQMIRTDTNTTSLDGGKTNIRNAFTGPLDFPNTLYYGVSGNVVKSETGNGYSIRLNLTDPVTKKVIVEDYGFPIRGLIDENQITPTMVGLTDAVIFSLIYGKNPTRKDLENLKQGAQKPN